MHQARTLTDVMAERQQLRGGTTLAVAMGIMNVSTYLYTILAARLLGPRDHGDAMALVAAPHVAAISRLAHLGRRPSRMKAEIPGAVAIFTLQIDECPMGEDEMIVIDDILGLKLPVSLVPRDKWL